MRRVFIALTHTLDTSEWKRRHEMGEVPDSSPYGLHRLCQHELDVTFSHPGTRFPQLRALAVPRLHSQTSDIEVSHVAENWRQMRSSHTDAVFCYDERTGLPAMALPDRKIAPVISGVAWLRRASADARLRWLARRGLPRADALFTQCAPMVDVIAGEWSVPSSRVHYIPLGIDTDFYAHQPLPDPADDPVVVSAGEDPFRDHELLITAVEMTRAKYSTRLELATGLPVSASGDWATVYTERMNGRMRDLYRRSTLVAIALKPTLTGSGLTVVLEAMASGRPVVVTDNPGVAEYVEHGRTGLLVPPGDPRAFADAIESLLADRDRTVEMGENAAKVARESLTSSDMSREFARLIHDVS